MNSVKLTVTNGTWCAWLAKMFYHLAIDISYVSTNAIKLISFEIRGMLFSWYTFG